MKPGIYEWQICGRPARSMNFDLPHYGGSNYVFGREIVMEARSYNAFAFDELSENIQERAIDNLRDIEYLTGDDAIKETILANEYMFTEDGDID